MEAEARILLCKRRVTEIEDELAAISGDLFDESEIIAALQDFTGLWDALEPREQARLIELLIEQVTYDGREARLSITYRPSGIRMLAAEFPVREETAA